MSGAGSNRQYFLNILWSWFSVVTLFGSAAFVSPVIFRRLGDVQAAVWTLALSFVEYFWMIDIGFRPATIKFCAEYLALGRNDRINQLINTAICYSACAGAAVFALIDLNRESIASFLNLTHPDFRFLLFAVALSWAVGLVFNIFSAALEGFQRFDLSSHASILVLFLRSAGSVVVVLNGQGLLALAWVMMCAQFAGYALTLFQFRRIFPSLRLSYRHLTWDAARQLFGYARQVAVALFSSRLMFAFLPGIISSLLSVRMVAYYTNSQKVLDYAGEGIGRVGQVTTPRVAEWQARGEMDRIRDLARYGNRYCLLLWLPLATFLAVYSQPLFGLWINGQFSRETAGLIPVLLVGYLLWFGQFISGTILMGMARYERFSASFLAEAVLVLSGAVYALPRFGLLGAAAAVPPEWP